MDDKINQASLLLAQPKEILTSIFSFFNQRDLRYIGATCKQLNILSKAHHKSLAMLDLPLGGSQNQSPSAAYFRLRGKNVELIDEMVLRKDIHVRYLLPFAGGFVFFASDSVVYDFWNEEKNQFQSVKLQSYLNAGVSAACVIDDNAFIAGNAAGKLYHYSRKSGSQHFNYRQFSLRTPELGIVALAKLDSLTFACLYTNGALAILKLSNDNKFYCVKEIKVDFGMIARPTCLAGDLDNLFLGFSDGKVAKCYLDQEAGVIKPIAIKSFAGLHVINITKILPGIVGVFFLNNQRVFLRNDKTDLNVDTTVLELNTYQVEKKMMNFIVPISTNEWIACDSVGRFTLMQCSFKEKLKLENEVENDNSLKPGFK